MRICAESWYLVLPRLAPQSARGAGRFSQTWGTRRYVNLCGCPAFFLWFCGVILTLSEAKGKDPSEACTTDAARSFSTSKLPYYSSNLR